MVISWPLRKRKSSQENKKENSPQFWERKWKLSPLEPPEGHQMLLTISSSGHVFLNHKPLEGKATLTSSNKWVFHDHFGYRLVLEKAADNQVTLYDEADEKLYKAEKFS